MAKTRRRKRPARAEPVAPAPLRPLTSPASPASRVSSASRERAFWVERLLQVLSVEAALPAILSLAALLRMAHLVALRSSPFYAGLTLDHLHYDRWALGLAQGDAGASSGVFFVDPLYAYFLAAIYRLLGHNLLWPRVAQLLLGVGTCWLAARIGRRVLGSVARGNLAALACALFVPAIFYEGEIEKTALGVFLFTLAVSLFLARTRGSALASGVALGAAVLTRGNLLVFALLGALFLASEGYRHARELVPAGLFGLGVLVTIAPATVHNYRAGHELVLTTANFGQNLFLGQNHENISGSYEAPSFVRPDAAYEESDFRAEAERRTGRTFTPSAASAYWASAARSEMAAAPAATLARTWRKFRLFFHQFETPDSENIELVADYSWVLGLPLLWFGWLTPLALLGAITLTPKNRDARVLCGVVLAYTVTVLSFFVLARFRAPVVPLLSVFAVAGVVWLERQYQLGQRRIFWGGVLLCGVVLAFNAIYPAELAEKRKSSLAIAYHNLASTLQAQGDVAGAIRMHERAVKVDDAAVPASLRELGEIYLKRRDYPRAEHAMQRVLELKPDSRMGKDALARLHAAMGRPDSPVPAIPGASPAPPAPAAPVRTGLDPARAAELRQKAQAFRKAEQWDQAIAALQQAIAVGGYDENLHYALGSWMEPHATPASMVSYWSEEAKTDPKPQTAYYYWAVGLERSGDDAGALAKLAQALEIDPAHELSELRTAHILERQKKHEQALAHCQTATKIFPDQRAAHEFCAQILRALGRTSEAEQELTLAKNSDPNTPRRYVYWARYLAEKGRTPAAVTELERALAQNPNDSEARALLDQLAPGAAPSPSAPGATVGALSDADVQTLRARLSAAPPGTPVWFVVSSDPSAAELARGLSAAFRAAGFRVAGERVANFPIKAGVFLFSAEEQPPRYVDTVSAALEAIGKKPVLGNGYRAYYEEKLQANPGYQGFAFASDQTYLIAIGPQR